MLSPPQIAHQPFQRAAVIRLILRHADLRLAIPLALAELRSILADQRLEAIGPPFAHFLRRTSTHFDLEVGLPIADPVRPSGRVDPGQLPACTVARAVHLGPWSHLATAWLDLDLWLAPHAQTPANDFWETYLTDPLATPDPTQHRTELNRPLRPGRSRERAFFDTA